MQFETKSILIHYITLNIQYKPSLLFGYNLQNIMSGKSIDEVNIHNYGTLFHTAWTITK